MRFTRLHCAGVFAATLVCGAANAHQIEIDNWQAAPTGNFTNSTSATVDFTNTALFGGTLAGVTSLILTPGTATPGFVVATANVGGSPPLQTEYAFGPANQDLTSPAEQIIIDPLTTAGGKVSEFTVAFNYAAGNGGAGETATLAINGVTYTAKNPATLTDTNGVFDFVGGVLNNMNAILTGWTSSAAGGGGGGGGGGGTMSAPEIDPASAGSALTLLAGGLMILASTRRKTARNAS